ncbi:MAG: translesion DNA synthesis-associated protein ImuA [Pseudomonadota bacterium]
MHRDFDLESQESQPSRASGRAPATVSALFGNIDDGGSTQTAAQTGPADPSELTREAPMAATQAATRAATKAAAKTAAKTAAKAATRKKPRELPEALQQVIRRRDTWLGIHAQHGVGSEFSFDGFSGRDEKDQGSTAKAANNDHHSHPHLSTGFAALDARLCEGGWPLGTCIEVLTDASGMGAMGLFLPAMQALSEQSRWQAFIGAPYTPYAPLLAARDIDTRQVLLVHPRDREEQLWSTEQALRSGTCSAVFSWLGKSEYRYAELRRLQLAAARGDTLAVLFRPREVAQQHAPASLRLQMQAYREVQILKQRSGLYDVNVYLPPEDDIPHQPQLWELPADSAAQGTRAVS